MSQLALTCRGTNIWETDLREGAVYNTREVTLQHDETPRITMQLHAQFQMYPWWGKQFRTKRSFPFLVSWRMGFKVSLLLISILALVHRGTSTIMLRTVCRIVHYSGG